MVNVMEDDRLTDITKEHINVYPEINVDEKLFALGKSAEEIATNLNLTLVDKDKATTFLVSDFSKKSNEFIFEALQKGKNVVAFLTVNDEIVIGNDKISAIAHTELFFVHTQSFLSDLDLSMLNNAEKEHIDYTLQNVLCTTLYGEKLASVYGNSDSVPKKYIAVVERYCIESGILTAVALNTNNLVGKNANLDTALKRIVGG